MGKDKLTFEMAARFAVQALGPRRFWPDENYDTHVAIHADIILEAMRYAYALAVHDLTPAAPCVNPYLLSGDELKRAEAHAR